MCSECDFISNHYSENDEELKVHMMHVCASYIAVLDVYKTGRGELLCNLAQSRYKHVLDLD